MLKYCFRRETIGVQEERILLFTDICYTSATVPVMLINFFRCRKTISYAGCMAQLFFLITCAGTECILLAVMAYDRYVAICKPLRYPSIMSKRLCVQLAGFSWLCGLVNSLVHTLLTSAVVICKSDQLSHFFCDVPLLLKLSCSETSVNEAMLHLASALIGLSPCLFTVVSYGHIISTILKIRSAKGRFKAFSTCTSHLIVVVIFYGTSNFNYNRPSSGYSLDIDTLVSSLYCIVTPTLNPVIYSFRNKEEQGTPLTICLAMIVLRLTVCIMKESYANKGIGAVLRITGTVHQDVEGARVSGGPCPFANLTAVLWHNY
ncbi:Olfactory receptor 5V1 [Chelonia mydas]|uniref:Olfactory receptor 5V1 n=1 Tax=Chelonia mydas TaxID=8469 RepID=M7BGQ7_CHEMY|nr:Olfactory receptor 5V1 [Chelonia mydas]